MPVSADSFTSQREARSPPLHCDGLSGGGGGGGGVHSPYGWRQSIGGPHLPGLHHAVQSVSQDTAVSLALPPSKNCTFVATQASE